MTQRLGDRVLGHLAAVYPQLPVTEREAVAAKIFDAVDLDPSMLHTDRAALPSRDEVLLITYGDTFVSPEGLSGFAALSTVLDGYFDDVFSTVHVLPFFDSSSDGGFSIIDHRSIAAANGDWGELLDLAEGRGLMVDLVCNHGSVRSEWFRQFRRDELPGRDYYKTVEPDADLSAVVRPRTHPLLVEVDTAAGARHVWATFSHDQVDFDFANPDVLIEFCSILAFYLRSGASRVRLDAIAYLWKEVGTTCIHLQQTHEIVKLMRSLSGALQPGSLLITETNVPHEENVAYFGDGDEAQLVYNFTLAPLLVWSVIAQQVAPLASWLRELTSPPPGCTFVNFIASHDGIGLRPIEDLVDDSQLDVLLAAATAVGGAWSPYATDDGPRPYELNVSLADLLAGVDGAHADRFLVAHAVMLVLAGLPAVYVHSILATAGDHDAVEASRHLRDINRSTISLVEVDELFADGWRKGVINDLCHLIRVRRAQPAFDPVAAQIVHDLHPNVLAVERRSADQRLLTLHNLSEHRCDVPLPTWAGATDVISGANVTRHAQGSSPDRDVSLAPWQAIWLG